MILGCLQVLACVLHTKNYMQYGNRSIHVEFGYMLTKNKGAYSTSEVMNLSSSDILDMSGVEEGLQKEVWGRKKYVLLNLAITEEKF